MEKASSQNIHSTSLRRGLDWVLNWTLNNSPEFILKKTYLRGRGLPSYKIKEYKASFWKSHASFCMKTQIGSITWLLQTEQLFSNMLNESARILWETKLRRIYRYLECGERKQLKYQLCLLYALNQMRFDDSRKFLGSFYLTKLRISR